MNDSILLWYLEAEGRCPGRIGVLSPLNPSGEADWALFLVIRTHSSRRDDAPDRPSSYAGAGRGRSPSISRRISPNNSLGTATSAIWKMT